ncbi:MAG: squalene-phytoene synthase, partial [Alphaproteobacteria bacterium]
LMPPAAAIAGLAWDRPVLTVFGGATWLAMTAAYLPTLRLYGQGPLAGLLLPASCLFYCAMTVDSARRHRQGKGGGWKGRSYSLDSLAGGDSGAETRAGTR